MSHDSSERSQSSTVTILVVAGFLFDSFPNLLVALVYYLAEIVTPSVAIVSSFAIDVFEKERMMCLILNPF